MTSTGRALRGYILVETVVAMAILAVSSVALQRSVQTAIQARGLAQDYITVRFLFNQLLSEIEMQPVLKEQRRQGKFKGINERFSYVWIVKRVPVPVPEIPSTVKPEVRQQIETQFKKYMGRVQITISWSRAGLKQEVISETLISPERMWLPGFDRDTP
ncbi:MAG: type II secretion system protein [Candidatus Hydrogenedentes bacterium]|nr:type II secretion system protein [Candidatus Hydrogenedentota bacterium]